MVKNLQISSDDKRINKFLLHSLVSSLKKEFRFSITNMEINFVGEMEIKKINNKYLDHNYSTDIITFDYSGSKKSLESEIYISIDDAASNAKKYKVSFNDEIIRLVIHGILHLLGYTDHTKGTKKVMKRLENQLFNKYKLRLNNAGIL